MSTSTTNNTNTTTITNNNNNTHHQHYPNKNNNETISSKIINRLHKLTPTTSKESIQTFTKWILFHATTHPIAIYDSLKYILIVNINNNDSGSSSTSTNNINNTNIDINTSVMELSSWSTMLNVYLSILHEICYHYSSICTVGSSGISGGGLGSNTGGGLSGVSGSLKNDNHDDNDNDDNDPNNIDTITNSHDHKWNKYSDFRSRLAENIILPFLEYIVSLLEQIYMPMSIETTTNNNDMVSSESSSTISMFMSIIQESPSHVTNILKCIQELKDNHKLSHMHSIWKDVDSFQSPTLLDDIERVIRNIDQFDIDGLIENVTNGTTTIRSIGRVTSNGSGSSGAVIGASTEATTAISADKDHSSSLDSNHVMKDELVDNEDSTGIVDEEKDERETVPNQTESINENQVVDEKKVRNDNKDTLDNNSIHTPTMDDDDNDNNEDDDNDMFGTGDSDDDNDDHNNNNSINELDMKVESDGMDDTVDDRDKPVVHDDDKADEEKEKVEGSTATGRKKRSYEESNTEIDFEKEVST